MTKLKKQQQTEDRCYTSCLTLAYADDMHGNTQKIAHLTGNGKGQLSISNKEMLANENLLNCPRHVMQRFISVGDAVGKSVVVVVVAEDNIMTKEVVILTEVDIMAKINSKACDQGNSWG